ncbi:cell wall-binding protein YocH precursor [Oxobacter pfennigii]|uniref:Cell wall-binding protein YocH n=1 Tax=Oxobacter pfennigii TaxID=36849 RepID=A0A0P9ADA3_9CLOT|nr:3D domain-containing protein [Oxobacter pfennigii]KPU43086.1 cell wall-binding protein YocH precursor [Oxobacter pfennigii]
MNKSFKDKMISFFSNNPAITLTCMLLLVVSLVIAGASQKEVFIIEGNKSTAAVTFKSTVGELLDQNQIQLDLKDKVFPGIDSMIKDGDRVIIKRAVPITVITDGEEIQFITAEENVEDMLFAEGIALDEKDKVYPEMDTAISKGMEVKVVRVTEKEITEKEIIAYTKEIQPKPDWEAGEEKELRQGENGEKEKTIKITYEDGVEKSREVIDEKIIKPAVSLLIAAGTLDTKVLSRGDTIRFEKMMVMKATSYTDDIANTGKIGGNTATGTKPRRISGGGKWSTVAVDPKVIPLGTELYIEGYGYAIAEDTGGAVKGNIIDLFFTQNTEEYLAWSTHKTKVYILK